MSAADDVTSLPPGWSPVAVEDLAADEPGALTDGPFGSNLKTSHYQPAGPGVIRLQNISDGSFVGEPAHISQSHFETLRRHEARTDDVLVAMLGEKLPRACLVPERLGPAIVKADCARLRVDQALALPKFVAYGLNSDLLRRQANELVHGVGRPRLGLGLLRGLVFDLAPLEEQHRIVAAIDSYFTRLDAAVANLERVQRNLKRYRASVLKAAVEGRLVPTEAELARAEGRDYEPAPLLLERILAERWRRWEASGQRGQYVEPLGPETNELPTLPEGWCWAAMGQLSEVSGGLTKNAVRDSLPLRFPYLRVANVYASELRLQDVEKIGVRETEVRRASLESGDLLIVEGNGSVEQIGRVARWTGEISPCLHQNHLIKARFNPLPLGEWALLWLLSPGGRRAIERVASSTSGLHTLSLSKVASLPVPLCPVAEQLRVQMTIERAIGSVKIEEDATEVGIRRCGRLRQSILKWAFEGKLADQDPNDEPASVLLERIRTERAAATIGSTAATKRRKKRAS